MPCHRPRRPVCVQIENGIILFHRVSSDVYEFRKTMLSSFWTWPPGSENDNPCLQRSHMFRTGNHRQKTSGRTTTVEVSQHASCSVQASAAAGASGTPLLPHDIHTAQSNESGCRCHTPLAAVGAPQPACCCATAAQRSSSAHACSLPSWRQPPQLQLCLLQHPGLLPSTQRVLDRPGRHTAQGHAQRSLWCHCWCRPRHSGAEQEP